MSSMFNASAISLYFSHCRTEETPRLPLTAASASASVMVLGVFAVSGVVDRTVRGTGGRAALAEFVTGALVVSAACDGVLRPTRSPAANAAPAIRTAARIFFVIRTLQSLDG